MSSSGSTLGNFDHLKPKNAKDPGWKYAHYTDINNKNSVVCELCGYVGSGGILRMKQHLAHPYPGSNARACPKVTPEIKKEIRDYLDATSKKKQIASQVLSDLYDGSDSEDDDVQEINLQRTTSSTPHSRAPLLSKGKSKTKRPRGFGPIDRFCRARPEDVIDARGKGKGPAQTTIDNRYKKEHRKTTLAHIGDWLYQAGVAFNAVKLKSFKVMIESIGQFGPGLKPPSYHEVREPMLKDAVHRTKDMCKVYETYWAEYGCSLMTDAWTDRAGRSIVNFLANCPEGTMFLKSIDASAEIHNADFYVREITKVINSIGPKNVVQVVTDNAAAMVAAGRKIESDFPHIFHTPCAAHCIDLILEDIGKLYLPYIAKGRKISVFFYKHTLLLERMRKAIGGNLLRPAVTRFATAFLTLQSLFGKKDALKRFVVSESFTSGPWAQKAEGQLVQRIILNENFWNGIVKALRSSQPLFTVLRMVDGEKPSMGYIYEYMENAKKLIMTNHGNRARDFRPIIDIVDQRWGHHMHSPLYSAAYILNPAVYYKADRSEVDATHTMGFLHCVEKMVAAVDEQDKISGRLLDYYKDARGIFGKPIVVRHREQKQPVDWWKSYGVDVVNRDMTLRNFAIRVLGLCTSASACERNWSTFESIHTKKRNRLEAKKLNDLVFVQYNQRLRERYLKLQALDSHYDPIALDQLEDDHPWLADCSSERVFSDPDDTLTWAEVERMAFQDEGGQSGGSSSGRRRRAQRQSQNPFEVAEDEDIQEEDEDVADIDQTYVNTDDEETPEEGTYQEEGDDSDDDDDSDGGGGQDQEPQWVRDQCVEYQANYYYGTGSQQQYYQYPYNYDY